MPPSGPKPEAVASPPEADGRRSPQSAPFQWNLIAWAGLVGALTGLAIVGFHELLGLFNNVLYGPFVEGLRIIAGTSELPSTDLPAVIHRPCSPRAAHR